MDSTELHDLGFRSSSFTWHRGRLFECLDRVISNDAWFSFFPNCLVTYLPRLKFDHKPLLLFFKPLLCSFKW